MDIFQNLNFRLHRLKNNVCVILQTFFFSFPMSFCFVCLTLSLFVNDFAPMDSLSLLQLQIDEEAQKREHNIFMDLINKFRQKKLR